MFGLLDVGLGGDNSHGDKYERSVEDRCGTKPCVGAGVNVVSNVCCRCHCSAADALCM